ncbi:MAG: DUF6760 family protein [Chloroflexota bacterium]
MREEVAFIAVGLGWRHDDILALTHRERAEWITVLNRINARQNRSTT